VKQALATAAEKRTEIQKYLFGKFSATLAVKPEDVASALNEADKRRVAELEAQAAEANAGRRTWGKLQAMYDVAPPPPTHLLLRGNYESPGAEVPPGFLRVLCRSEADAVATVAPAHEGTSGRRTALARWLTATDSPAAGLLARVQVNRIWRQLFGRGLVSTPDNFGVQGQRPTHPELLDWLAAEFMAGGWRVKPLMKSMLLSSAYRQASRRESTEPATATNPQPAPNSEAVDPANDLLWKMRLRRLESEVVRDAILAAGGRLIYYGAAGMHWVDFKIRDLQKASGYRDSRPIAVRAVYVGPPFNHRKERFKSVSADVLRQSSDAFDPAALEGFVQALRQAKEVQR